MCNFLRDAEHIEYHVQITESLFECSMSSTIARADCSCQFVVSLVAVHSLFSALFACTIYFTENDISTVLSSRADRTKLKCVSRPLLLRIRYQRCEFIIGSFSLSLARINTKVIERTYQNMSRSSTTLSSAKEKTHRRPPDLPN